MNRRSVIRSCSTRRSRAHSCCSSHRADLRCPLPCLIRNTETGTAERRAMGGKSVTSMNLLCCCSKCPLSTSFTSTVTKWPSRKPVDVPLSYDTALWQRMHVFLSTMERILRLSPTKCAAMFFGICATALPVRRERWKGSTFLLWCCVRLLLRGQVRRKGKRPRSRRWI